MGGGKKDSSVFRACAWHALSNLIPDISYGSTGVVPEYSASGMWNPKTKRNKKEQEEACLEGAVLFL